MAKSIDPKCYPDTDLPEKALSFRVQAYGMDKHYKLFTNRQLMALITFSDLVKEAREKVLTDSLMGNRTSNAVGARSDTGSSGYADAVATYLAFPVGRSADYWATTATWYPANQQIGHTFTKQAIPMVWDFAEANPFSRSSGSWRSLWGTTLDAFRGFPPSTQGSCKQQDATSAITPDHNSVISTDPPYYDNIGYADLSDFFYVWLRRALGSVYPELLATLLTPKLQELIASPYRHEGSRQRAQVFFEEGLGKAFAQMRAAQHPDFPLTLYYAFKQTEKDSSREAQRGVKIPGAATASTGWETMLGGLLSSGLSVHGTWPMRSEQHHRMVAHGTNALASSIVLVCRPRPESSPMATRREFIDALKAELPTALEHLQAGSIAPVDLAQAAIGPGMAVFSRYSKVMESDGSAMRVRTALELINQVLDEVLEEQEGEFDADTRWAVSWFSQHGHGVGPYGDAEQLSKSRNVGLNGLVDAGILESRAGKVRLLQRQELAEDWSPQTDSRLTVWETTQYLIRALEEEGENGVAQLIAQLGASAETARDLAYRLYVLCERNSWSQEAIGYNSLVIAWPESTRLAMSVEPPPSEDEQQSLF